MTTRACFEVIRIFKMCSRDLRSHSVLETAARTLLRRLCAFEVTDRNPWCQSDQPLFNNTLFGLAPSMEQCSGGVCPSGLVPFGARALRRLGLLPFGACALRPSLRHASMPSSMPLGHQEAGRCRSDIFLGHQEAGRLSARKHCAVVQFTRNHCSSML